MILSSSLRVSVCLFWALLLLGFIHVLCRCIFSRCWHHRISRKWKCQKCGDACWCFFFFFWALLLILPSCMWLSMSYVWWFIEGFVCFSCRVLNGTGVQGSEVRFKDSFRCLWESGLLKDAVVCSLCMPSLRCRWLCTFSVLTVWDSACVWCLYLLVLTIFWASRVAGSPSLLSSFTNRPQRKLVRHLRACLLVV